MPGIGRLRKRNGRRPSLLSTRGLQRHKLLRHGLLGGSRTLCGLRRLLGHDLLDPSPTAASGKGGLARRRGGPEHGPSAHHMLLGRWRRRHGVVTAARGHGAGSVRTVPVRHFRQLPEVGVGHQEVQIFQFLHMRSQLLLEHISAVREFLQGTHELVAAYDVALATGLRPHCRAPVEAGKAREEDRGLTEDGSTAQGVDGATPHTGLGLAANEDVDPAHTVTLSQDLGAGREDLVVHMPNQHLREVRVAVSEGLHLPDLIRLLHLWGIALLSDIATVHHRCPGLGPRVVAAS
mmetsp:Transcript_85928/g.191228  ORF Transcript_85928/g.191228 Transcript_85928/m.191228 type:complete len:292 (+) Transcript_85928:1040-1915(+)